MTGKTAAERLMDLGRAEEAVHSRQQALLLVLRRKFHKVPAAVEKAIKATREPKRLDSWLGDAVDANTIDDVGITPADE